MMFLDKGPPTYPPIRWKNHFSNRAFSARTLAAHRVQLPIIGSEIPMRPRKHWVTGPVDRPSRGGRIVCFKSARYRSIKAFAADPIGNVLPDRYAPWTSDSCERSIPADRLTFPVASAIQLVGFFLLGGNVLCPASLVR
jgi:hypothetical protein